VDYLDRRATRILATQVFGDESAMTFFGRWLGATQARMSQAPKASVKVPGRRLFMLGNIDAIEGAFVHIQAQQQ